MQDDLAQYHALRCLRELSGRVHEAMVVVSQLKFRQYLDNVTNPLAAWRLPRVQSLPPHLADGECDLLIIHRTRGLIVGEIKSVGASAHFASLPESQRQQTITSKVEAAVNQLNNQGLVLAHLVQDLNVGVTKRLILPFVTSAQLLQAVNGTPVAQVTAKFVGCLMS